jgi:oligopeptide/dipeptide ABC transporter ATP-binding protein
MTGPENPGAPRGFALELKRVSTSLRVGSQLRPVVIGVDLQVGAGEIVGLVGESGSGKSMTALSIMGLIPDPGRVTGGEIHFRRQDLLKLSSEEVREIRGKDIAMIFQDPLSSLNPVLRTGYQIAEAMLAHGSVDKRSALARAVDLLRQVRVPAPEQRARDYPFQLSGGMRQRAMIAMGLSNAPSVLIADEPTTALDVTVQAQILKLLRDLNRDTGTAIMLISHNLAVVAGLCTRVIVMYAGQIVEEGPVLDVFEHPQHPYTWSLLRSIPRLDEKRHERLRSIEGLPPDLIAPPQGCRFHPRCPFRVERCFGDAPPLEETAPGQRAACWVTMDRAREEMGADTLIDVRPGAGSGIHGPAGRPAGG